MWQETEICEEAKKRKNSEHILYCCSNYVANAIWEISSIDNFNEFHVHSVALRFSAGLVYLVLVDVTRSHFLPHTESGTYFDENGKCDG